MHMASSLISKVAKAKMYAAEPERLQFHSFALTVRGDNDTHTVTFQEGVWDCTCKGFHEDHFCAHTMAVERILSVTIPQALRQGEPFDASGIHQV